MPVLIFRLNNVPEDEAVDVKALLDERGFAYHETSGGFLGFGVAGLWLLDASQKTAAREVIDAYERERAARFAAEQDARRRAGELETMLQRIARRPLESLFYIVAALGIVYLMLWPFTMLGE